MDPDPTPKKAEEVLADADPAPEPAAEPKQDDPPPVSTFL
jgi:hypothetical protein